MKYWREAASVILAASRRHHGKMTGTPQAVVSSLQSGPESSKTALSFDYQVLMLQRAQKSSFFAGAQVFPGGGIDEADFSPKWLQLFAAAGIKTVEDLGPIVGARPDRPPMIAAQRDSPVPNDLAFRICAIRETFEESGILLVKHFSDCRPATTSVELGNHKLFDAIGGVAIKEWRQRVHKNASEFLKLCRELNCVPNVWSLAEWSNWLTPSSFIKKRYDTMFYLCCLDTLPVASQDEEEIDKAEWVTPSHSIAQFLVGEFFLPPPQIYELQRLCRFPNLSELLQFSQQRALLGCQRYLPVRFNCSDGVFTTLPGDQHYPEEPVLETSPEGIVNLEKRIDEVADFSKSLNRIVFSQNNTPTCKAVCNITLPNNHCRPLPMEECATIVTPKL